MPDTATRRRQTPVGRLAPASTPGIGSPAAKAAYAGGRSAGRGLGGLGGVNHLLTFLGLFVFAAALLPAGAIDLCYKVEYNYQGGKYLGEQLSKPISHWPKRHPLVRGDTIYPGQGFKGWNQCMQRSFRTDEKIPAGKSTCGNTCRQAYKKNPGPTDCSNTPTTQCVTAPYKNCDTKNPGRSEASALFYQYISSRANTGYEDYYAFQIYFIQDEDDDVWLDIVLDGCPNGCGNKPNHPAGLHYNNQPPGGNCRWSLTSTGVPASSMYVTLMDDKNPTKGTFKTAADKQSGDNYRTLCDARNGNAAKDCAAWDEVNAEGSFSFTWSATASDGVGMGPLPSKDFALNFEFGSFDDTGGKNPHNFVKYQIKSYNADTKDLDSVEFSDAQKAMFRKIRVTGYDCNAYCGQITNCGQCIYGTAGECGWCPNSGTCLTQALKSSCAGGLSYLDSNSKRQPSGTCNEGCGCSTIPDCGGCTATPGCAWCNGQCKEGSRRVREAAGRRG